MKQKLTYERPTIYKYQTGIMNKFGSTPYYSQNHRKTIENIPINALVEEFGSPLFVFSEKSIRCKYRNTYNAFATRYPDVKFGWSYKTNYLSAICSIYHQEGTLAEVVSEMEYEMAIANGVSGENIIFNGPCKSMAALERAVTDGAMIHIDHMDEISDLEKVSEKLNKRIPVAIRLNMDTKIYPQWSRFGFNLESGQAIDAVKRIVTGDKLIIRGLHCHIGTFILDPNAYALQVEKMINFGYQIEDDYGFKMQYYDLGGGFPSKSHLKGIYLPPEVAIESIDTYAEKITDALYANLRGNDRPQIIFESGRCLIDESAWLISTVFTSKRLPDGRKAYVVDAGLNMLFTSFWYKHNIELDRPLQGISEPSIIYGPLCMNIDVVNEGILLPHIPNGTRLIISPVGAYNVTQWMQFIEYRPSIVLIGENGEKDIIREKENLNDVKQREYIPDRFY